MKNSVILESYNSMPDAAIVQGMLEAHGIEVMLDNRNNIYVPVFGGVDLIVDKEDYDRARCLLTEFKD
ncbi:MAG: DUF2007 domain-containing protein [Candidatus Amulumruptor caecigallinarius]|nr:DUF2007 domain-containing protein [Candidatus Amulumruptor caecigallinarius]